MSPLPAANTAAAKTPSTPSSHPAADCVAALIAAFEAGAVDRALGLYTPDAVFVAQPGQVLRGHAEIGPALAALMALRPRMSTFAQQVLADDHVALYQSDWKLEGQTPLGDPVCLSGRSADVLRRQADGQWLIAVDNPWGSALLDTRG